MQYKAHKNEATNEIQTVAQHCENTAKLCKEFSVKEMSEVVTAIGLLHDVGKYQASFQRRIDDIDNNRVEHSTCGAIVANEAYKKPLSSMMGYCIAGHHSGLPDGGAPNDTADISTLQGRMKRKFDNFDVYKDELKIPDINIKDFIGFLSQDCCENAAKLIDKYAFLTRYCFSCLVDADSIDTATFCSGEENHLLNADFNACLNEINKKLEGFECKTKLQKSRAVLQKQVFDKIEEDSEIYLMNMPTGSGKTLCSMKFALERAVLKNKKRIIYIAPYNGIIDQTAAEFEELFKGKADILRHQSSFSYEEADDFSEDYRKAAKSATENWQAPIIISTMVQFFESIYSNRRGKLRKLHNMADSVLIFDEAHLLPQKYLKPCLQAIAYITKYLHSEAVLLTATMPDYTKMIKEYALPTGEVLNLIDDTSIFKDFKKCEYINLEQVSKEKLLENAIKFPSSLIVVNKKKTARELYEMASGEKYHLSTYMTVFDRTRVIAKIKTALKQLEQDFSLGEPVPESRRVIVISTSLIEAGIDLDMHGVFREINGLDSILQTGGRCNREGRFESASAFVFSFEEESTRAYSFDRTNLTKGMLEKYSDISCNDCINEYYNRLIFMNKEEIEAQSISYRTASLESIPFKEYAQDFEIINSPNESIVVAQDAHSQEIVDSFRNTGIGNARKVQKYICSVSRKEFDSLYNQGALNDFKTGIWCLTNLDYYDNETGICFEARDYIL